MWSYAGLMRTIVQMSYADAFLSYAQSYVESYASYARRLMRHTTLHKIKCRNKSYASYAPLWVLQVKSYARLMCVLCTWSGEVYSQLQDVTRSVVPLR